MKISYDKETDALNIVFKEGRVSKTLEMAPEVILDLFGNYWSKGKIWQESHRQNISKKFQLYQFQKSYCLRKDSHNVTQTIIEARTRGK